METDTKERLLKVFQASYPADLSIKEAAQQALMARATASKWVTVLVAEGKLTESRRIGNAVLFLLKKGAQEGGRTPESVIRQ